MLEEVQSEICPVCKEKATLKGFSNDDTGIECRKCGEFKITDYFRMNAFLSNDKIVVKEGDREYRIRIPDFQGAIKEANIANLKPYIGWKSDPNEEWNTLEEFLSTISIPKTPTDKIDKLLENLARKSNNQYGTSFSISQNSHKNLMYAKTDAEFRFLIEGAKKLGYLDVSFASAAGTYKFILSMHAWDRLEEIRSSNVDSQQGFVACWFGIPHIPSSDAIEEGIVRAGFSPLVLRGRHFPETIISKALGEIKKSRFVVVDLTEQRKSVFLEAGFALGKGIQVIFVISKEYWENNEEDLEFYVKNYNIKPYSSSEELTEIVETAIKERIN